MTHPVVGIDHCVVLVRDLDRAEERYSRLGFQLLPRGRHSDHMGTGNHCIMLAGGYVELLGVLAARPANESWRRSLLDGEGLKSVALASPDADRARHVFLGAGLEAGELLEFSRPVEVDGQRGDARFRVTRLAPGIVPGLDFFVCQHDTPDLVWLPGADRHENGALSLLGLTIASPNAEIDAEQAARLFPAGSRRGTLVETGRGRLRFVKHPTLASLFPGIRFESLPPFAAALHVQVSEPTQAARLLTRNDVPFIRAADGTVLVPPQLACGVLVAFQTQTL
ncbi:MAG: VOC family protein [Alphaproteobacteria bacterium]|nr:VOC family protein [Alphaproteobacteria bacterium]